jgi:hypothetical protein
MTLKTLSVVAIAAILSACASAPMMQTLQPNGANAAYALSRAPALEASSHLDRLVDTDKSILYHQTFGGGGVALGLLGGLGVVANMAMIDSNTKADAAQLNDRIHVQPRALFADVARKEGLTLNDTVAGSKLTPYLYIVKLEGNKVLLAAAALVEQDGAAGKWQGKYMYQLPQAYSFDELKDLGDARTGELQTAVASGYAKIITQFRAENAERLAQEPQVRFKSDFMQQRSTYDMAATLAGEEGDVVWLRTSGGVYGLRKANVTMNRM